MKRSFSGLAVLVPVVLVAAGCGGGSSASTSAATPYSGATKTKTKTETAAGAVVDAKKTGLGTVLVDSSGRTLYLFEKDKGHTSTCSGACATAWPPLTTASKPKPGSGVDAAKLGTSKRSDGTSEVTYAGHPLYTYAGDGSPGATTGEGVDSFGAEWYVLSPKGTKVEDHAS
jgi:predicted lipoprotein with Yx(FWY)xxD motif